MESEYSRLYMYQVVKKLNSLKSPLNKLGWSKGNLAKLVEEFYEAEADEEKFLYQEAKIKWLCEGDKNSRFFHRVLKGRKCKSKVHFITDNAGIRHEGDHIPQVFLKHFQEFLGTSYLVKDIESVETLFKKNLRTEEVEKMISEFSNKVIKEALLDIDDSKALGPDGFSSNFFKKPGMKAHSRQYHAYSGNYEYNRKGGPKRVAFKIDIQKAYDIVNWEFLKKILSEFSIHNIMVNWIMQYNLLLMCYGDTTSVKVIKKALDAFSSCSELMPNNSKTTVFFGSMKEEDNNEISFCRLQLIAAILESIHSKKANGKAKVAWSSIYRPKDQGGLSLKNLDLYDERLNEDLKVRDMIVNGGWVWPNDWFEKFLLSTSLEVPSIDEQVEDKIVWKTNNGKLVDFTVNGTRWNDIIQALIDSGNGNNINSVIRRLILATNVYNIWSERNRRIFLDEKRSGEEVFKIIINVVKNKLSGLIVKDSYAVKKVESVNG
ncbi:hypothetical protein Tco_1402676 [Tanacetum coccineum]